MAIGIRLGTRVTAGETDEDRDTGTVVDIDGDQITVAWDGSNERTTQRAAALEVVS